MIITLLLTGIALISLSIALAVIATANKNIIGGADWPTFRFVFFYEKRGLYSTLAFLGALFMIASAVINKKK